MKGEFLALGVEQASVTTLSAFEGGVEISDSCEYLAGVIKGEFLKGVTTKKGFLDGEIGTSPLAVGVLHTSSRGGFFLAVGGV